jgi:hypothetical protein
VSRKPQRPIMPAHDMPRCSDDLIPLQRALLGAAQRDDAAWAMFLRLTDAMDEMERP